MTGRYRDAIKYANKIINGMNDDYRHDIKAISYLITLILQFELRGPGHLDFIIKSSEKFLKKNKRLDQFEKTIITFFKKADKKYAFDQVPKKEFGVLVEKLNEIIQNNLDVYSTNKYYKFNLWAESRYTGVDQVSLNKKAPVHLEI